MDYLQIYNQLVAKRIAEPLPKGVLGGREKHHILPKSVGGKNTKDNLVYLSVREHFVAHRLLAKIYPDSTLTYAVWLMTCFHKKSDGFILSSRLYEKLRKDHAERVSNNSFKSEMTSKKLTGRKQSAEHIAARTKSRLENGPWLSKEAKDNISNGVKEAYLNGKLIPRGFTKEDHIKSVATRKANGSYVQTPAQKEGLRLSNLGKRNPKSADTIERLKHEYKTLVVTCPHCGKSGSKLPMGRWHFDKCKLKGNK
jgi:hypothetical protein